TPSHRKKSSLSRRSTPASSRGSACERTGHSRPDVVLLFVFRLSRRARAVFAHGRRVCRRAADGCFARGNHPEDFRRSGFGSAAGKLSIAGLFMAGVVPGMMIGFGLMIYCYFFGPSGMRKSRAPLRQVIFATGDAALPLMIPVILLGGILTGWFTPTEAGVVAVIWIIAVVIPALNRGHLKRIPYDFCLAGLIFSLPLITIGAANAFGWMLAYLRGAIVFADG